ncbi:MAG: CsbD family protein [Parachlamydia sp.]|nr:CsbD family protein [Parachlamydia sp.]
MNKEQLIGNWNEIKGKVKEQFGKLTDDDLARIEGKRDQLIGAIQKNYGCSKEEAETKFRNFESRLAKFVGHVKEDFDVPRKTGTEG